ncbi:MAG TPA: hypothetical protein VFK10_06690, partial [Burkholderiaceae bacterium]|nr:hypothetical protein [Burkholderiaceae bacterium]
MSRTALAVAAAGVSLALAACVAVPVDPRTGLPVAWPQAQPASQGQAPAIAPPTPAAPPSPVVYTARLYPTNDVANRAG